MAELAPVRNRKPSFRQKDGLDPFERFCSELLTTDTGRPLIVEGFQKEMLGGYFAGIRETLALLSKKNGKSSLLAALGLYELCSIPNAEVAIVAASRDQAGLILRQARGYIRRSERLRERLRVVPAGDPPHPPRGRDEGVSRRLRHSGRVDR